MEWSIRAPPTGEHPREANGFSFIHTTPLYLMTEVKL